MKKHSLLVLIVLMLLSTSVFADVIVSMSAPSKVEPNQQVDVTVNYKSWWKKDIVISLKRTSDWKTFGQKRYTIANTDGDEVSITKSFTTASDIPTESDYIIEVKMFDIGKWEVLAEDKKKVEIITLDDDGYEEDKLFSMDAPDEVKAQQEVGVEFTYQAGEKQDLLISLKRKSDQKVFGSKSYTIESTNGEEASLTKTFTTADQIPANGDYMIEVELILKGTAEVLNNLTQNVAVKSDPDQEYEGDKIIAVSASEKVEANQEVGVTFTYQALEERDVVISLKRTSDWAEFGSKRYTMPVTEGKHVSLVKTFTTASRIPNAGDYIIEVKMFVKGGWELISEGSRGATISEGDTDPDSDTNPKEYFHIKDGQLYDANQNVFVPRGVNVAFYDWINESEKALPNISKTGANSLRIMWMAEEKKGNLGQLDRYIQSTIDNKMIPMVHLWDVTHDYNNPEELKRMAQYWADNIDLVNKYKKHILLNIANEWSMWGIDNAKWRDAYKDAIKIIRDTGYDGVLVVDAAANAQNPKSIRDFGQELMDYDAKLMGEKEGNLLFSIHMYIEWAKNPLHENKPNFYIDNELEAIRGSKLPLVIGEFGYTNREHSNCTLIKIDAPEIMAECNKNDFGYYAWSWAGNGTEKCNGVEYSIDQLDMVANRQWTSNNYSEWGRIVVQDPNGLSTAEICSVFETTPDEEPDDSSITAVPNPVPDQSNIKLKLGSAYNLSGSIQVTIQNTLGLQVYTRELIPTEITTTKDKKLLELPRTRPLAEGTYYIRVIQGKVNNSIRIIKK